MDPAAGCLVQEVSSPAALTAGPAPSRSTPCTAPSSHLPMVEVALPMPACQKVLCHLSVSVIRTFRLTQVSHRAPRALRTSFTEVPCIPFDHISSLHLLRNRIQAWKEVRPLIAPFRLLLQGEGILAFTEVRQVAASSSSRSLVTLSTPQGQ